ncbi:polo kinase 1-like protein [Dinothrombium tinctorium]|uniref:Serine/threonine-protein kinase PLK n=1 Tax=Dinothrombium tinctorium TaxID=1965070 RepID=A0A443R1B3_9ACAR|nr:polo kinase 1-like protein [Dinothrombium tinctorium]
MEIPDVVYDTNAKKKYAKGKFLGRGGFAKCYELIESSSNAIFAGKVIAKALLQKSDQKEKMSQEIAIHRSISHKHIVSFNSYFEDKNYIYIILELCSKRTNDLKDTYKRIRHNEYRIPPNIPPDICLFINKMLQSDPKVRPTMKKILADSYMVNNYIPSKLPQSCLTMAPNFNFNGRLSIMPPTEKCASPRRPLVEMNQEKNGVAVVAKAEEAAKTERPNLEPAAIPKGVDDGQVNDYNLRDLFHQLQKVVAAKPEQKVPIVDEEAEDPAATPIFWISKWVDYTDRYGIGYQLCDNSIGILFNDITRIALFADGHNLQYIERDGTEHFHALDCYPQTLFKKITLLKYFRNYMNEHLVKTGENVKTNDIEDITRLPNLNNWFRTRNAIVFHLTNGTVQINFFQDHTKLILCPHMGAVTYINESRDFRTYRFSLIEKHGISKCVAVRLRYARDVVERLMSHKLSSNTKSGART